MHVVRSATTFTVTPPHSSLFGTPAVTPAPSSSFVAYSHPRIVLDAPDWVKQLSKYSSSANFNRPPSWSLHFRQFSLGKGPQSPFISDLTALERNGSTQQYSSEEDLSSLNPDRRADLEQLASYMSFFDEGTSHALFSCALWTSVKEVIPASREMDSAFIDTDVLDCVHAAVALAKILMVHRAFHCAGSCASGAAADRAHVWDYSKRYEVSNDWYTSGMNLALTYDVLYDRMSPVQQRVIRSAIALLVLKKASWGNTITSDVHSPNAMKHPHRIYSNWALYHSNIYLTNLAIEGETDFDVYTTAVLKSEGETGFNAGLHMRFEAMIDAYMKHSIYPDGSTFEDGYTYFLALREGSLALIAAHRRGLNVFDTNRFRGLIHNLAQMYEPWHCGRLIGHASGGGESYAAYAALFRYVFPDGALPNMLWRQRMGQEFKSKNPCRIYWGQYLTQLAFMGDEHGSVTDAESPQGLPKHLSQHIPLSYFAPRRGLLIARTGLSEKDTYIHFDARPDAFFPGHDNADRGIFTVAAYRASWVDDFAWRENSDSRKHSLMHIDGLAQDEKAPSVRMLKTEDDGTTVIAAADLTYAYNVQWAKDWPDEKPPTRIILKHLGNGSTEKVATEFSTREMGDPQDFGWPAGDDGADIGMTRPEFSLHGDSDMGFRGMWTWKRAYREVPLEWGVRSVVLSRVEGTYGYFLVTDSFKLSGGVGNHLFESYLTISDGVSINTTISSCSEGRCKLVLKREGISAQMDIHVLTRGTEVSYRTEMFTSEGLHTRVIISSVGGQSEEFWLAFQAHGTEEESFEMVPVGNGVRVSYGSDRNFFVVDSMSHAVVQVTESFLVRAGTDQNDFQQRKRKLRFQRGTKPHGSSTSTVKQPVQLQQKPLFKRSRPSHPRGTDF